LIEKTSLKEFADTLPRMFQQCDSQSYFADVTAGMLRAKIKSVMGSTFLFARYHRLANCCSKCCAISAVETQRRRSDEVSAKEQPVTGCKFFRLNTNVCLIKTVAQARSRRVARWPCVQSGNWTRPAKPPQRDGDSDSPANDVEVLSGAPLRNPCSALSKNLDLVSPPG
jgi:hypothetical protein